MKHKLSMTVLAFVLLSLPALGQEQLPVLVGVVTKIVDGDTIDVQLTSGPIWVRLHGVDTPERGQPWGTEAAAALTSMVSGKQVEIEPFSQDRYDYQASKTWKLRAFRFLIRGQWLDRLCRNPRAEEKTQRQYVCA